MFKIFRNIRQLLWFSGERAGDYAELIQLELVLFRQSLVRTLLGYALVGTCVTFFLGFVSMALLVTFWDTSHRVLAAWCIAAGWLLLAALAGGLTYAMRETNTPFHEIGDEIRRDLQAARGGA